MHKLGFKSVYVAYVYVQKAYLYIFYTHDVLNICKIYTNACSVAHQHIDRLIIDISIWGWLGTVVHYLPTNPQQA